MVNHFASLLANFNLVGVIPTRQDLLLVTEEENVFLGGNNFDDSNYFLAAEEDHIKYKITRKYNNFINNNYIHLDLPEELLNFYKLIFPKENNLNQNQFLLYTYLSLIAATDLNTDTTLFDKRITYDLKNWENYFKFLKINYNDKAFGDFNLSFTGKFNYSNFTNLGPLHFNISQQQNTNQILIYSPDLRKYFKQGKETSPYYLDMESTVNYNSNSTTSDLIQLGDTGLFFRFTGDLNNFTTTSNKSWLFLLEYPYFFDFNTTLKNIENNYPIIDRMLDFRKSACNSSYSNIWYKHYNSVYRFSGLLLSYVERVNILWQEHE
jgi:hypothetical protein